MAGVVVFVRLPRSQGKFGQIWEVILARFEAKFEVAVPKNNMTMEKMHLKMHLSCLKKWWFSSVTLVFRGVFFTFVVIRRSPRSDIFFFQSTCDFEVNLGEIFAILFYMEHYFYCDSIVSRYLVSLSESNFVLRWLLYFAPCKMTTMARQPTTGPNVTFPRKQPAIWSGLINHWFLWIRPAIKPLSNWGGYVALGW